MKKLITTALALILCAAMTITAGLQLASAAEIPDPPVPTETAQPVGPKDPDKGGDAGPQGRELLIDKLITKVDPIPSRGVLSLRLESFSDHDRFR